MFKKTVVSPDDLVQWTEGNKSYTVRRKNARFRILLRLIPDIVKKIVNDTNRPVFHKLAWALGEAGEVEMCEAIMKGAEKPKVVTYTYMGYTGYYNSP